MNKVYKYFYLAYVTIWLLNEFKYVDRINYSPSESKANYTLINELIVGNFLFGAIGIVISLLIASHQKTSIYFISTCAIGLAVAVGTLYLDSSVTGNANQAHIDSGLAVFAWLIPLVVAAWSGIITDIIAAIIKNRYDK